MDEIRVLSPTAILGYGFPKSSLEEGLRRKPHVIGVDAGSTDVGPYYLGMEKVSCAAAANSLLERDLRLLLKASHTAGIPLLIGSAGLAGADDHLEATIQIIRKLASELNLCFRMAVIRAEVEKDYVKRKLRKRKIVPLGPVPALTTEEVDASARIVGQMGVEPFIRALEADAGVIVAGRANDPSMFAALPILQGFDRGLALHMAKILECGAIAAEPGSGSDAMIGYLRKDHFVVEPLNQDRIATVTSVAAHSLYEKSDPLNLYGPGGKVDLTETAFEQINKRQVKVSGSRYVPDDVFRIKLEGSKPVGYRTIAIAGVRDPITIERIDQLIEDVKSAVDERLAEECRKYHLIFHTYGRDGVMRGLEPGANKLPHELCIIIEAVASSQEMADDICTLTRTLMLHFGFPGRISTAGNLAFPFSPLDIPVGPVYEFNIYHLVEENDPCRLFPMEILEV